jgi:hypothetical protein
MTMPGPRKLTGFRKFIAFGSGVGIEIRGKNLEITAIRVRPNGIDVQETLTISGFRERRAAEWGAEYARFLAGIGGTHLAATVLLPRHETIVRQIALPGVAARDLASAVALQIDTLHPYGEDEVVSAWSRLESGGVLVAVLRRNTLDEYVALFAEAGIAVASFTFSAAAIYVARRMPVAGPPAHEGGFVAVTACDSGGFEIYGESAARPVFSADFDLPLERAVTLAASELRLEPGHQALPLDRILPAPRTNPVNNDLSRRALPYATALAGACPWLGAAANLLPVEHRQSNSRAMFIPTAVLGAFLLLVAGALLAYSAIEDHRYLSALQAEISKTEPQARRAAALDAEFARAQNRIHLLDEFRGRTKADLDVLNGLTTLLPPTIWTNMIDLTPDAATIGGEAEQAAPLLKLLDGSPYFQNSAFVGSIAKSAGGDQFQIRATRRVGP